MLTLKGLGKRTSSMSAQATPDQSFAPAVSAQQEQTRALITAMVSLTGLSASALAREAGLTPSTLNRFMHQAVRHTLSQRTLLALMVATFRLMKSRGIAALDAAALSVLAPILPSYERAILEHVPDAERVLKEIKLRMGAGLASLTRQTTGSPRDLPVVTAATLGVDVAARNFDTAPLTTSRPPFLADDAHAFALLLTDSSMTPRYDSGDMLYVSPARDAAGGNVDVVVERKTGGFFVGRLTHTSDSSITVLKLQPQESFEIPRAQIRGLYRIVGVQHLSA
ncbi:MAG: helix-turn-helix transcriptional regulator [Rhodospirillaceae bacterium]|nr:helix-turn-helix transcriptional regulator [Rhodospirillaceae bacterium]